MSFIFQDGLYLVTQYPEVVKNYKKAILTPNVVEFSRLYEKVVSFDFILIFTILKLDVYCFENNVGVQWLSGRVLDSRPRRRWFEPHVHHCIVSLSKTH